MNHISGDVTNLPLLLFCVSFRNPRGEPSAQASKEEESQERDMRPFCGPLYAKDFISCLCNTFCEKNFDKGLCDGHKP